MKKTRARAPEGLAVHLARGRPKKGQGSGPTLPRSIRFAEPIWKLLEERAKAEGVSLHAILRTAVMDWIERSGAAKSSAGKIQA